MRRRTFLRAVASLPALTWPALPPFTQVYSAETDPDAIEYGDSENTPAAQLVALYDDDLATGIEYQP